MIETIAEESSNLWNGVAESLLIEVNNKTALLIAIAIILSNILVRPIAQRKLDSNWERMHLRKELAATRRLLLSNQELLCDIISSKKNANRAYFRAMNIPGSLA
ncbi:MAG: hypothetical protein AAFR64_12350, partial [Pseudomonadota bacterium]